MNDYLDDSRESAEDMTAAQPKQGPALIKKFVIRLPKGLRNKIKHLSEKNRRSMNSEIIMVLEKHIQNNQIIQQANINEDAIRDSALALAREFTNNKQQPFDDGLSRRLENLPEEKKQALLELLG